MLFAWVVLFMALATWVRHPLQIERALKVVVFASVPVCAYAILQKAGLDPMPWRDDVTFRCSSTLGNPVFLGAYASMLLPITAALILRARAYWLYACIWALQAAALGATGSRGPLVGGLAGLLMFALLLLRIRGARRRAAALYGLCALLAISVAFLQNILPEHDAGGSSARRVLGHMLDARESSVRVRLATWQAVASLVFRPAPSAPAADRPDRLNALRPWIGYGPECLALVFDPVYPVEIERLEKKSAILDRAHNETWDTLVSTGLVGWASLWTFYLALFMCGLQRLALLRGRRDSMVLLAHALGGGGVCALLAGMWKGVALAGVGFPLGLLAGLMLYLVRRGADADAPPPLAANPVIGVALLAGMTAHMVEIQFGFATITTRTLFFAFAALLVGWNRPSERRRHVARRLSRRQVMAGIATSVLVALLMAVVCVRPIYASMLFTQGLKRQAAQDLPGAILLFSRALGLAPSEEVYRATRAKTRYLLATRQTDVQTRDALMEESLQDIRRTQALRLPWAEPALNLGGLYTGWAAHTADPALRRQRAQLADAAYAQAVQTSPNRVRAWQERALLHWRILQSPELAARYLQCAFELDPNDAKTHELLGAYHDRMGHDTTNEMVRVHHLGLALEHYEWRLELANGQYASALSVDLYVRLAIVCCELKKLDDRGLWVPHPRLRYTADQKAQPGYRRISYGHWARQYAADALRLAGVERQAEVQALLSQIDFLACDGD